jgi:hypothetical protein
VNTPPESQPPSQSSDEPGDAADLYLQPVPVAWSRAAGVVLLIAAIGSAAVLGYGLLQRWSQAGSIAPTSSSELIFELMLVVLWGFCAQAGWRLVFSRARRPGALFSWVVWLALGAVLLTLTGIIALLRLAAAGAWNQRDLQVILFGGGIGGWCLWLAWKAGRGDRPVVPD